MELEGENYEQAQKSDIYALGILIYRMIINKTINYTKNEIMNNDPEI